MDEDGTFDGHLVYFTDTSNNLCHLVHLLINWYIFCFGKYHREKSGNPVTQGLKRNDDLQEFKFGPPKNSRFLSLEI
jgi:hypothetical protein